MKLSIIIPAYNEESYIEQTLKNVLAADTCGWQKEIIIVNDGSTDSTSRILKRIESKHRQSSQIESNSTTKSDLASRILQTSRESTSKSASIRIINKRKNEGKGSAIKKGFKVSTGDLLLIQDADFEYSPADYPKLIKPFFKKNIQVVYGSRHLKKNQYSSLTYYLGGVLVDKIISFVLGANITDAITGSKVLRRKVYNKIKPLESKGFEIEAELTAKIVKAGIVPYEVPIIYKPRTHKEGKNIKWHHAFNILRALFKYS